MKYLSSLLSLAAFWAVLGLVGCNSDGTTTPAPAASPAAAPLGSSLNYADPHAFSITQVISPPPVTGSSEQIADLAEVHSLQDSRTPADCARANVEANAGLDAFFGPAYGPLTAAEVTKLAPFFAKITTDEKFFVSQGKNLWKRPRPYVEDSSIKPCIPLDPSFSYPSGHATQARVFADVLDLLDPRRKAEFDQRGVQVGNDRVLGGVHHPSDIEAGQKLGDEIFNALEKSAAFEADLKKVEAVLGSP